MSIKKKSHINHYSQLHIILVRNNTPWKITKKFENSTLCQELLENPALQAGRVQDYPSQQVFLHLWKR